MKCIHKSKINILLAIIVILSIITALACIIKYNYDKNTDVIIENEEGKKEAETRKESKCIVTFIDDDGMGSFSGILKPVLKSNDVKCSLAIIAGKVGKEGHMSLNTLKGLESEGYEIISHSYMSELHNISDVNALDSELQKAKDFLVNNNFGGADIIAYPTGFDLDAVYNGRSGKDTVEHVKKYFKYGFNSRGSNGKKLNNYMIARVDFNKELSELKKDVDESFSKKTYLVFMVHSWQENFDTHKLDELIKYIKSKNIEILTASKALEYYN